MRRHLFSVAVFTFTILFSTAVWVGDAVADDHKITVKGDDLVKITAKGIANYRALTDETKKQALEKAKEAALKRFTSTLPTAKKRLLKSMNKLFYESVEDFIVEVKIQQEKDWPDKGKFAVVIAAYIDPGAIDAFFIDNSAAGNQNVGDASDFGAMFIARQEVSRRAFDVKTTKVSGSESSASTKEESASSGTSSVDSTTSKSLEVERSGGSRQRKRDKVSYEPSLEVSEEVAFAVEEQLVNAGFEPMGIDELDDVPFLDEIIGKMKKSGRMPKRIEKRYKRAAIDAGWSFLGMGLIDIGVPEQDAARGTVRVSAIVSFKVWRLTDGRAKTVASVRPQAVYGQDRSNASVAQTNAYNEAVKLALDTVVAQLQKKGLR